MNLDKVEKIINENFDKREKVGPKSDKKIINAKVKGKGLAEGAEVDFSSNVMGLGIGFNF